MTPEIIAAVILLTIAAYIDWKEHRVPNWLNYSAMAFGLVFHIAISGSHGLYLSLAGIGVGFATLVIPYLLRGMGAGDVKLMMAVGAWLGPWVTFQGFVWTVIIGALMGMTLMIRSRQLKERMLTVGIASRNLMQMKNLNYGNEENAPETILLPYGVPIAFGFYAYFLFGGLI